MVGKLPPPVVSNTREELLHASLLTIGHRGPQQRFQGALVSIVGKQEMRRADRGCPLRAALSLLVNACSIPDTEACAAATSRSASRITARFCNRDKFGASGNNNLRNLLKPSCLQPAQSECPEYHRTSRMLPENGDRPHLQRERASKLLCRLAASRAERWLSSDFESLIKSVFDAVVSIRLGDRDALIHVNTMQRDAAG